jgi:anti-sigma28 factor (negative regulator of flagellin synthesis)
MERINDTQEFNRTTDNSVNEQISNPNAKMRRPRSLTTLRLEVVAERARKMKRIKEALAIDTYKIDSNIIAKSLLQKFDEDDLQ